MTSTMASCAGCQSAIGPSEEVVELNHGVKVHLKCFKCVKCSTQLSASDAKYQHSDLSHGFVCKEHKGGFAKSLQERARRSFRVAMKSGKMLVSPAAKKVKPPAEVGVPTPIAVEGPGLHRESTEDPGSELLQEQAHDEFETVLVDAPDETEPELPPALPAKSPREEGAANSAPSSPPLTLDIAPPGLRRTSTGAVSHPSAAAQSTSPSFAGLGDVASIIQTVASTISNASRTLQKQMTSQDSIGSPTRQMDDVSLAATPRVTSVPPVPTIEEQPESADEDQQEAPDDVSEDEDDAEDQVSSPRDREEEEHHAFDREAVRDEEDEDHVSLDRQSSLGDTALEGQVPTLEEATAVDEDEGEEAKQMRAATDPLNMLTTAVAKELELLPQGQSKSAESEDGEEEEPAQPWVYPPAFSGVSPIQISVVDPDHLWMFLEGPLMERMAHSKVGGAKRAKFVTAESLKPMAPVAIYSRYRNPYVHVYLVKCDSLQDYTGTVRPRLRAFKEDVERREDPEWLLVSVESAGESKKVFEKMKQDFGKDRVVSISVSEDARWLAQKTVQMTGETAQIPGAGTEIKLRRAGDGQWGDLAQRVGTCIVRAFEHRRPIYGRSITEELDREMDWSYFNVFTRTESLAFACLQCDKFEEALDLYIDLNVRFKRGIESKDPLLEKVVKCGMTDDSGSSVKRLPCHKLLFPAVSLGSTEQDAVRAQIHHTFPARVFDVERLPFRDLIGTSTVSGVQLQMYIWSRIVLCMLALGRAKDAVETSRQYVMALRNNLRIAYIADWTIIDAWVIAASLEIVAAGHACASVFAADVDPADRVGMCLGQALLLERSRSAMEDISRRETKEFVHEIAHVDKFERTAVPALALKHFPVLARETNLPPGLARAFFSSPDSFRTMYARLLEASAAHFVAAGRFRFAASLTHIRALLLLTNSSAPRKDAEVLFEDACRWWGGGPRTVVSGEGTAALTYKTLHDDWPALKAETSLFAGRTDRVARDVQWVQPPFRRLDLASKTFDEMGKGFPQDALVPIEVMVDELPSKLTEDDPWRCRFKMRFKLQELAEFMSLGSIVRCVVRFRSDTGSAFRDLESLGEIDGAFFDAESIATDTAPTALGVYRPFEAFVYLVGHPNVRLRGLLSTTGKPTTIGIVERAFPFECRIDAPQLIASGTCFEEGSGGENDVVAERQELVLVLTPRTYTRKSFPTPQCEAIITCSDSSVELSESKDKKVSSPCLRVRFDCQTQRKFSLVVSSPTSSPALQPVKLLVDIQTVPTDDDASPVRKAPRYEREVVYCAPVKVTHEVRFGGSDGHEAACVTLVVENVLPRSVELVSCELSSVSSEALDMRTSPITPFPCALKPQSPLRQTFVILGLDDLVPNRVGGRSLILLQAALRVRFQADQSECVLQWYVPLVVGRAEVVRTRWKEGEALSFSRPALESARFGIDWKKLDEDTEVAPVIAIHDDALED